MSAARCRVCGGHVTYSGTGAPPAYCGDACRRIQRASAARRRRARHLEPRPDCPIDGAFLSGRADAPVTPEQRLAAMQAETRLRRHMRARALRQEPRPVRRYSGPPRLGYVYRLRDDEGRLLYVGKTCDVYKRLFEWAGAHALTKPWFPEVVVADVAVFATEAAALEAEAWAIERETPLYNLARPPRKKKHPPRPLARYSGEVHPA